MPYQPTKPLSTDQLNVSQGDIAGNFTAIGTQLDPNNGIVKFPRQGGDVATAATDVGLYSKLSTLSTQTELFFRKQASGTVIEFTSCLGNVNGWTRLPSGILLKWGTATMNADDMTYTYPVAATIPAFAHIYNVQVTGNSDLGAIPAQHRMYVYTLTTTTFSIHFNNTYGFNYLAIGD